MIGGSTFGPRPKIVVRPSALTQLKPKRLSFAQPASKALGLGRIRHPGRASTVGEIGALSDFDDVAVRIADVAANLAVLWYRFRNELRSSTFP